ncbi:MAG: hypothetical protein JW810_01295 [Sedimentisphaerales bacterium]|nr:hypothetical protein [Sedimentisphaerales bacterium]
MEQWQAADSSPNLNDMLSHESAMGRKGEIVGKISIPFQITITGCLL